MDPTADLPPDAVPTTRTEANGDVITEYRVAGQLRVVRVELSRGPVYYLYDRNRDGLPDEEGDNPPYTYLKLFYWNLAATNARMHPTGVSVPAAIAATRLIMTQHRSSAPLHAYLCRRGTTRQKRGRGARGDRH